MPASSPSEIVTMAPRRLRLAFLASCIFFVPAWAYVAYAMTAMPGCPPAPFPGIGFVGMQFASVPLLAMISEDGGSWIGNRVLVIASAFASAMLVTATSDFLYWWQPLCVFTAFYTVLGIGWIPAVGVMLHEICSGATTHADARQKLLGATGRIWRSIAVVAIMPAVAVELGPVALAIGIVAAIALAVRGVGERTLMPSTFADVAVVATIFAWLETVAV